MAKATRFRVARTTRGLTQMDVARLTRLSQSVVSDLERGKNTNPTWDVLSRLAQLYGRRPEDLLPHVPLPQPPHPLRDASQTLASDPPAADIQTTKCPVTS